MMKSSHNLFETKQFLNALVILSIAERSCHKTDNEACVEVATRVVNSPIHRIINDLAEKLDRAICDEVENIKKH